MKAIQEQIEVMQHYANGGEIETLDLTDTESKWDFIKSPSWHWVDFDYRIKEQNKTITIEKWLCKHRATERYEVIEGNELFYKDYGSKFEQIKLLESKEIEL